MKEVKPGEFYYGFVCKKCKRPILMFEDPHKGRGPVKVVGEAKITTKCTYPDCLHEDVYLIGELQYLEAARLH